MSKKTLLIGFAAGAIAGWTAAQRSADETPSWSSSTSDNDTSPPTPWNSRPETPPTRPFVAGGDPFRGAFAGAMAEVEAHLDKSENPETEVA